MYCNRANERIVGQICRNNQENDVEINWLIWGNNWFSPTAKPIAYKTEYKLIACRLTLVEHVFQESKN